MPARHPSKPRLTSPENVPAPQAVSPGSATPTHAAAEPIDFGINAVFAEATRAVFQTMLSCDVRMHSYLPGTQMRGQGLAVMIALNGAVAGTLALCISQRAARNFVAALTGIPVESIGQEVIVDGICELVNMIAGAAKAHLDATEMRFDMTLPVSYAGDDFCINLKGGMPGGVMQCGWGEETFQLGVWRVKDGWS